MWCNNTFLVFTGALGQKSGFCHFCTESLKILPLKILPPILYLWTEANFCNICQICKCDTRHQQVMFIVFIFDIVYTLHMNCKSWLSFFPFFLIQCWQPSLLFVWTIVVQNFNDKWSKVNYDNLLYCTLIVTIFYSFWPVVIKMVDRSGYKIKNKDESGTGWIRIGLWIYSIRLLLDTCKD